MKLKTFSYFDWVFIIAPLYKAYVHNCPVWGYSEQALDASSKTGDERITEDIFWKFLHRLVEDTSGYMTVFFF